MSFYVYILRCSDGSYYTGHTDNLEKRVAAHQEDAVPGYTFARRPVQLVFAEDFPSREEAFLRERQIKGVVKTEESGADSKRLGASQGFSPCSWFDRLTTSGNKGITTGEGPLILSLSKDEHPSA